VNYHPQSLAHYITHIWAEDQDGTVIYMEEFEAGMFVGKAASVTFVVPEGTVSMKPFQRCNLHGLYVGRSTNLDAATIREPTPGFGLNMFQRQASPLQRQLRMETNRQHRRLAGEGGNGSSVKPFYIFEMAHDLECYKISVAFIVVIGITILLEYATHSLGHWIQEEASEQDSHLFAQVVSKLYRELTILGFIGFTVMMLIQSQFFEDHDLIDELHAFEFAHIIIFFIALTFIVQAFVFMMIIARMKHKILCYPGLLTPSTNAMQAESHTQKMKELERKFHKEKHGTFFSFSQTYHEVVYHIMRSEFMQEYHMPCDFEFGEYMCKGIDHFIIELLDPSPLTWLVLITLICFNMLRAESSSLSQQGELTFLILIGMSICCSVAGILLFANKLIGHLMTVAGVQNISDMWDVLVAKKAKIEETTKLEQGKAHSQSADGKGKATREEAFAESMESVRKRVRNWNIRRRVRAHQEKSCWEKYAGILGGNKRMKRNEVAPMGSAGGGSAAVGSGSQQQPYRSSSMDGGGGSAVQPVSSSSEPKASVERQPSVPELKVAGGNSGGGAELPGGADDKDREQKLPPKLGRQHSMDMLGAAHHDHAKELMPDGHALSKVDLDALEAIVQKEQMPVLAQLSREQLAELCDHMVAVTFPDGSVIIKQGEEILSSSCFYVVKEGEVVIRKHGQTLRSRGVGQFFGERSLIENLPRSADVVAKGQVECLAMNMTTFASFMEPYYDSLHSTIAQYERFDFDLPLLPSRSLAAIRYLSRALDVLVLFNCGYIVLVSAYMLPYMGQWDSSVEWLYVLLLILPPLVTLFLLTPLCVRNLSYVSFAAQMHVGVLEDVVDHALELARIRKWVMRGLAFRISELDAHLKKESGSGGAKTGMEVFFEVADRDGNKEVNLSEFKHALESVDVFLPRREQQALMRFVDLDRSGKIDLDEFKLLVYGEQAEEHDTERKEEEGEKAKLFSRMAPGSPGEVDVSGGEGGARRVTPEEEALHAARFSPKKGDVGAGSFAAEGAGTEEVQGEKKRTSGGSDEQQMAEILQDADGEEKQVAIPEQQPLPPGPPMPSSTDA
jgi:hypothetical protein